MATTGDPDSPSLACQAQNPAVLTAAARAPPLPNTACSPISSPWAAPSPASRQVTARGKRPGSSDAQSLSRAAASTPIGERPHVSVPQHGQPSFDDQDPGRLGRSRNSAIEATGLSPRMAAGTETGIAVDNVSTASYLDAARHRAQPMISEDMHATSTSADQENALPRRDVLMMMDSPSAVTLVEDVLHGWPQGSSFDLLPNEVLSHILSFLDVCDLLATSRVSRSRSAGCFWDEVNLLVTPSHDLGGFANPPSLEGPVCSLCRPPYVWPPRALLTYQYSFSN